MYELLGKTLNSRLFLGSGRYPSPDCLRQCIEVSHTNVVTVSLRREHIQANERNNRFWEQIKSTDVHILPNTAGCYNVKDAVNTAFMARELFDTNWIKLEVIGDNQLQPCPFGTVEAARILVQEGFDVFPYTTDDAIVADRLVEAGCKVLMPWGAPIGTGLGIINPRALENLRRRFPSVFLVVDAGVGRASDASKVMEMGYDAVLVNTAVSKSYHPVLMAESFAEAVSAGRKCYEAVPMKVKDKAEPSSPLIGIPFHGL